MKISRISEEQIIAIFKEHHAGHGISDATNLLQLSD